MKLYYINDFFSIPVTFYPFSVGFIRILFIRLILRFSPIFCILYLCGTLNRMVGDKVVVPHGLEMGLFPKSCKGGYQKIYLHTMFLISYSIFK